MQRPFLCNENKEGSAHGGVLYKKTTVWRILRHTLEYTRICAIYESQQKDNFISLSLLFVCVSPWADIYFFGSPQGTKHKGVYFLKTDDGLSELVAFVQNWGILQTRCFFFLENLITIGREHWKLDKQFHSFNNFFAVMLTKKLIDV